MFAFRRALARAPKSPFARAFASTSTQTALSRRVLNKKVVWAASVAFAGLALASTHKVHLDAVVNAGEDETVGEKLLQLPPALLTQFSGSGYINQLPQGPDHSFQAET